MIGDSLASDIAGGAGYGIDTCWFNPRAVPADGEIAATYEIRRLDQLLDLLDAPGVPDGTGTGRTVDGSRRE